RSSRRKAPRRSGGGGASMSVRIYIPRDAGAVAVGAGEVGRALRDAAARRGLAIEIGPTGSRGLYWLEPMVEVATSAGRVAYGPARLTAPTPALEGTACTAP